YFSRGGRSSLHLCTIMNRNIHNPCCGVKECPVFKNGTFIQQSTNSKRPRYICSMCFEKEGGHFFKRKGKGNKSKDSCNDKHLDDKMKTLELFGQWMNSMTDSPDKVMQNILIEEMWQMINRCYFRKKEILKESETINE